MITDTSRWCNETFATLEDVGLHDEKIMERIDDCETAVN
jgi:hypothetical protein